MTDMFTWVYPTRWLSLDHADKPPHQCCRIVDDEPCGLWCGHDGDHTPHQIGAYLPPSILGPLDLLRFWRDHRCPLCGTRESNANFGPALVFREGRFRDSELETEWRFWPCGCEGREILPEEST